MKSTESITGKQVQKDTWDKSLVFAQILAAILVPFILVFINIKIGSIEKSLNWQKHNLTILQEFQKIYFDEEKRGLSLRYINLIKDDKITQIELRKFIIWDILNRNIMTKRNKKNHSFKFDSNVNDWHYLGENTASLLRTSPEEGSQFYKKVKELAPGTFKDYGAPKAINDIFEWLEVSYPIGTRVIN